MAIDKRVCAVGFCCADVYKDLGKFYPTGNGIDWGVHLARMGVQVSAVSVVGTDQYGADMRTALCGMLDPTIADDPNTTLANIRQRLSMMCGGSMDIESREGGGTVVKVTIPL